MKNILISTLALTVLVMMSPSGLAGEVEVVSAKARSAGKDSFRFDVTLRHADAGWAHYADNWEVLTLDGKLLGRRVLLHPHDNEQPFTRLMASRFRPASPRLGCEGMTRCTSMAVRNLSSIFRVENLGAENPAVQTAVCFSACWSGRMAAT